jgi:hypothetical protein
MTNPQWTGLTINAKSIPLGSWVKPQAEINGFPVPLQWGDNHIPAQPGVHHIRIHMPWLWQYGKAEITVDNRTQPAPPVYYAPPFINFLNGAIGFSPVKHPGLLAFFLILGVPLAIILICCLGSAIFNS